MDMSDEFDPGTVPSETTTVEETTTTTTTTLTPSEARDKKQMDDYQKKVEAERAEKANKGEPITD